MGLRGELYSTRVILANRTYFFNVKENRMGDLYLNIVESKNRDVGGFDRQSVILFADDLQEFLKGFDEALRILEKETRERRRAKRDTARDVKQDTHREGRTPIRGGNTKYGRDSEKANPKDSHRDNFSEKPRKGRPPREGRRVVVKKR